MAARILPDLDLIEKRWQELEATRKETESLSIGNVDAKEKAAFEDEAWFTLHITRIGVIITILFLVQVFITMYRYNTRLSAFHRARAHALKPSMVDFEFGDDFKQLADILTPDAVDFTKGPTNPSDQIIKGVEKISGLGRRGGGT